MDDQRTDEWFEARLGKATASRFADILASPSTAAYRNYKAQLVIERLVGVKEEGYTSPSMQHGIENEELAKLAYSALTGREVKDTGFMEHEFLDAGASPDGLVGTDGLIEIKCPNTATHIDTLKSQKTPTRYMAQMQGQMWIAKRNWCDFISFDPRLPDNAQMYIKRVQRDDEYIKNLEQTITKFLTAVEQDFNFINEYGGVI